MNTWDYDLWCQYNEEHFDDATGQWVYNYEDEEEEGE